MTTDTSDTSIPAVTATTTPAVPPPAVSVVLPAEIAATTAAAQPPEADDADLVVLGCMVEAVDPGLLAEIRATHDRLAALAAEPATGPPVAALPLVRRITPLCDRLVHAVAVIDPPSGSELPDPSTALAAEPDWLPDAAPDSASATNETDETYQRVAQWSGAAELWALVERLAATHPLSPHPPSPPGSSPSVRREGIRDAPRAARVSPKRGTTRKPMAQTIAGWVKRDGVAP